MNSYERVIAALERRQPDRVPLVEWVVDERVMEAMLPGCDYFAFNDWLGLDNAGMNRSSWQRDNVDYVPTHKQVIFGHHFTSIAGTGPMEASLRALVATDKSSQVQFEGHCEGERLTSLYQNAAFVVVPSEWYENAPMAILESFAYGKAVVASRIGGIPELVTDKETGYLFTSGDRAELRAKVSAFWMDKEAQRRMGYNARKRIETTYSQDRRTESLLNIYEQLCGRRTAVGHGCSS